MVVTECHFPDIPRIPFAFPQSNWGVGALSFSGDPFVLLGHILQ
jgi:hypothetical protein